MKNKTHFEAVILAVCFFSSAAVFGGELRGWLVNPVGPSPEKLAHDKAQQERQKAKTDLALAQQAFVPKDPWRVIDGQTNFAKGPDWKQFTGTVVDVKPTGILMRGWFGRPLEDDGESREFFVVNFPYEVADNEIISLNQILVAKESGVLTFGINTTVRRLDYGKIWIPPAKVPLTAEQQASVKLAASKKAQAAAESALKYNEDLASKGDAYGQLRMGERYRDGDCVEKDLSKAREMFSKSAAQGNLAATAALEKLPAP